MVITDLFWKVIGLGIAIPGTFVCLLTLFTAWRAEDFSISFGRLGLAYFITILGWAILFGIKAV